MKKSQILLLICFLIVGTASRAQDKLPFINEIQAFKKQDSIQSPPKKAILFVGSSSFRLWKDLESAFPKHQLINRGFGGSSLPDVIRYADDIILPYKPKQVVIYCGENDFTAPGVNADLVFERFKSLFERIRVELPRTHILYVSIKPSPSRAKYRVEIERANELIQKFIEGNKRAEFVDVYHPMLQADGQPMPDLFLADKLHMNSKGYAIWQEQIAPHLKK